MSGEEAVDDDSGADQRQRDEGDADAGAGEVLGQGRADLRADGRAGVHDERDEDVDARSFPRRTLPGSSAFT
jgi:hypothetical protein